MKFQITFTVKRRDKSPYERRSEFSLTVPSEQQTSMMPRLASDQTVIIEVLEIKRIATKLEKDS